MAGYHIAMHSSIGLSHNVVSNHVPLNPPESERDTVLCPGCGSMKTRRCRPPSPPLNPEPPPVDACRASPLPGDPNRSHASSSSNSDVDWRPGAPNESPEMLGESSRTTNDPDGDVGIDAESRRARRPACIAVFAMEMSPSLGLLHMLAPPPAITLPVTLPAPVTPPTPLRGDVTDDGSAKVTTLAWLRSEGPRPAPSVSAETEREMP